MNRRHRRFDRRRLRCNEAGERTHPGGIEPPNGGI